MNISLLTKTLVILMTFTSFSSLSQVKAQGKVNYSCIQHQGKPKTVADTSRGKIQLIVWESQYFKNSGWTPQKRCQEISKRFQKFSDNGTLRYITTGRMNNQPVICTGTRTAGSGYKCMSDGLLMTLQPNDNPNQVLQDLFSKATRKGGSPVVRSVQTTNYTVSVQSTLDQAPLLEENKSPTQIVAQKSQRVYSCIQHQGKPMTIVDTSRGRIQLIVWESRFFESSQSQWTPQKRCDEVTKRFQSFSDTGNLRYIATGKMTGNNGYKYNVICVSGGQISPGSNITCNSSGLLLTLEPKDNPDDVMKDLFQQAVKVGTMPVRRSQRVLDMEKYLTQAPLMDSSPTVISPPVPKPRPNPQPNPQPPKPDPLPKTGEVIECPPVLCD